MDIQAIEEWLTPLQKLLLAYARKGDRPRYAAAFALDNRLAQSVRDASEPLLGQIRISWWRDRLADIATAQDAGEPLLELLYMLNGQGADIAAAAALVDSWEAVLLGDADRAGAGHALQDRGAAMFAFAVQNDVLSAEQRQWAGHWSRWDWLQRDDDAERVTQQWRLWREDIARPPHGLFDRSARPLSMLCRLVYDERRAVQPGTDLYRPKVAVRLIWHGITGR